ncbi:PREDICTED: pyridoxine/pyridoxamine 5'-phosphate oxidase 1, chloroplastic-like isoform X2 [Erythranthe guttata]|uniref:pyridoxine/pyridoxamine 5'-phosphate oxidase 1, chloroplastic-like isoform X2 n=1 Tax=Erythranthe guttata TaxID=4155 RepID=UPI00064DB119|nr:PREDICTED: pyridoxine/pyridoxamine 5'-phosphate oxidase 1, chloroplastic-like isoform X2 [Erythranthe guttata]|eukprot:XP_012831168.1 PREDICTED: pyridoxine/pyridoxamine 5'-phosphate oxidase 1, chloroplastic-like isoform X2 [Erythranthe guttata]
MEDEKPISYLTQQQAAEIDELLVGPLSFTIDQLMELGGLSVASAIAEVYRPNEHNLVLVICGPGNNGGHGLVAARHLHHFGYKLFVCYPNRNLKPLFTGLVTQLDSLSIPFLSIESLPREYLNFDIIVDAIFSFSFHGNPKPPFDNLIRSLASLREHYQERKKSRFVVSVDIPSGWHVEEGDITGDGIKPDMLVKKKITGFFFFFPKFALLVHRNFFHLKSLVYKVSLTAPKLCAKAFLGSYHFLGGRFIPPFIVQKYKLRLPPYNGTSMCVQIGKPPRTNLKARPENVEADPFVQFKKWLDDAAAAGLKEPKAVSLSTATKDGKPSSRVVLLKKFDRRGFVWCSNYGSRKGREISENPHASLLFYWNILNRQVRVEGFVQKVSNEESEEYFCTRPREIKIVPAVSKTSTEISGREILHQQCKELEEKYPEGTTIPRPVNWGGYRLVPESFEFWQGDESCVHLRLFLSFRFCRIYINCKNIHLSSAHTHPHGCVCFFVCGDEWWMLQHVYFTRCCSLYISYSFELIFLLFLTSSVYLFSSTFCRG